jgi:hypothetical protein
MALDQDDVYKEVKGHIRTLWTCIAGGFTHYRENYPDQEIHRKTTRACNVNDIIFAKVIAAFDEVPGAHIIDNPNQPRVLSLSSRVSLWFKKLDDNRLTANYPTEEALKRDGGQSNLFEEAEIIVAGYMLSDDESAVKRITFSPPKFVQPRWFIDVEAVAQPIQMKGPQRAAPSKVRLKVIVGPNQIMLG